MTLTSDSGVKVILWHWKHFLRRPLTLRMFVSINSFKLLLHSVALLYRDGVVDRTGWHPPGGDSRTKKMWVNLQRMVDKRARTGKKRCEVIPSRGWHPSEIKWQWWAKKVVSFSGENNYGPHCITDRRWWLKWPIGFQEKIGVTPSVAAPGDNHHYWRHCQWPKWRNIASCGIAYMLNGQRTDGKTWKCDADA